MPSSTKKKKSKNLKDKAVEIHGKKYVLVKDRVLKFNEEYEHGMIQTKLLENVDNRVVVKAKVTPDIADSDRYFTGLAEEIRGSSNINKTSALENAETSAVGRALAMLGIGVLDAVASADEVKNAKKQSNTKKKSKKKKSKKTSGVIYTVKGEVEKSGVVKKAEDGSWILREIIIGGEEFTSFEDWSDYMGVEGEWRYRYDEQYDNNKLLPLKDQSTNQGSTAEAAEEAVEKSEKEKAQAEINSQKGEVPFE